MTLIVQSKIENKEYECIKKWHFEVANELLAFLRPPSAFPCFFSQNSCSRKMILFSFVEGLDQLSLREAASDLADYVEISRRWDGDVATAQPLVMMFCPSTVSSPDTQGYHALGWEVLRFWRTIDTVPWPEGVSEDPNSPFWTMCFNGMQLFINMSNPAHEIRRSRNLGSALTFVINPRERFDIVAGDNPPGWKIRSQIRRRILAYDGIEHSPKLGSYQAGELEWWQYGLEEHNGEVGFSCPMHARVKPNE